MICYVNCQHNSTIINSQPSTPDNAGSASNCNCRVKANCPMNGESVVYRATVRSQDTEKDYTGLTASTFKQRFNSHQHSMRHRKHRHSTALSNYVWSLKDQDITFDIKWTVLRKAAAYRNTTRRCNLCIAEKLEIMKADKDRSLNRRLELVSKCRHENQFSAISLPRFHDSCVPVCISFLISSVSLLGVCLLSSGASFRSSFLISSVPSLGICLNFLVFRFILFYFIYIFLFLFLYFYIFTRALFLYFSPKAAPPPPCQILMAVHRTVPHSGPSLT